MAAGARPTIDLSPAVLRLAALPILTVIATKRDDESIQLNPIWFELADGYIWVNSNTRRSWPMHLQRDRQATLLITDPAEPERYAQIRGRLAERSEERRVGKEGRSRRAGWCTNRHA